MWQVVGVRFSPRSSAMAALASRAPPLTCDDLLQLKP